MAKSFIRTGVRWARMWNIATYPKRKWFTRSVTTSAAALVLSGRPACRSWWAAHLGGPAWSPRVQLSTLLFNLPNFAVVSLFKLLSSSRLEWRGWRAEFQYAEKARASISPATTRTTRDSRVLATCAYKIFLRCIFFRSSWRSRPASCAQPTTHVVSMQVVIK